MDTLSKSDFVALGGDDVPGDQLRARVFMLEGLVAEMWGALDEVFSRTSFYLRSYEGGRATALRAAEILDEVEERYFKGRVRCAECGGIDIRPRRPECSGVIHEQKETP